MNRKEILTSMLMAIIGIVVVVLVSVIPAGASYREEVAYPEPTVYSPYPEPNGILPTPSTYITGTAPIERVLITDTLEAESPYYFFETYMQAKPQYQYRVRNEPYNFRYRYAAPNERK